MVTLVEVLEYLRKNGMTKFSSLFDLFGYSVCDAVARLYERKFIEKYFSFKGKLVLYSKKRRGLIIDITPRALGYMNKCRARTFLETPMGVRAKTYLRRDWYRI